MSRPSSGLRTALVGLAIGSLTVPTLADDPRDFPSRLGRIFGLGPRPAQNGLAGADRPLPPGTTPGTVTRPGPNGSAAVETPRLNTGGPAPRLVPQPRTTRPAIEADPLMTRVGMARSDNGAQFALFLQVYADGTVVDAEGVHRVPADLVRNLSRAIHDGDLLRRRGHCGAPSTDYVEQYHVTTFERSGRALKANTFSYTSNPQGCDPSVGRMHQAAEAIVLKLAGGGAAAPSGGTAAPGGVVPPTTPGPSVSLPTLGPPVSPNLPSAPEPAADPTDDVPPLLPPVSTGPSPRSIPLTPVPD